MVKIASIRIDSCAAEQRKLNCPAILRFLTVRSTIKMDPATTLVFVTFMTLLNGGLLGLMHAALPTAMQPSAASWRIGSLLVAAGLIILAIQSYFPPSFILPTGNFCLVLGVTGYWRSIRQFYGQTDRYWMLFPTLIATFAVWWFSSLTPSLPARVAWVSLSCACVIFGCMWTLYVEGASQPSISRKTLIGIFGFMCAFMLVRMSYFLLTHSDQTTFLDARNWMNLITPLMLAILPVTGTTAFLLMCSDRIRRDWEYAASTDALTGLANRRTLALSAPKLIERAQKAGTGFALAIIDIDHFKSINDRFGHEVGDAALKHVAEVLKSACPTDALLSRHGGEEFVALFSASINTLQIDPVQLDPLQLDRTQLDRMQASALNAVAPSNHPKLANNRAYERIFSANSEKLLTALHACEFVRSDIRIAITVSIGLAIFHEGESNLDELLRRADQALYTAKSSGRDCVVVAQ